MQGPSNSFQNMQTAGNVMQQAAQLAPQQAQSMQQSTVAASSQLGSYMQQQYSQFANGGNASTYPVHANSVGGMQGQVGYNKLTMDAAAPTANAMASTQLKSSPSYNGGYNQPQQQGMQYNKPWNQYNGQPSQYNGGQLNQYNGQINPYNGQLNQYNGYLNQNGGMQNGQGMQPYGRSTVVPAQSYPSSSQPSAWSTGLCDCCSDCFVCWHHSSIALLYGENYRKLHGDNFCGCCLLYACCSCFACFFAGPTRGTLRNKYNLPAEPCGDFVLHWCCSPCAVCQEARELRIRDRWI